MKTILELFEEAKRTAEEEAAGIERFRSMLQAVQTKIPPAMATIKNHFLNSNEFELYEFLDNCNWWECKIGKAMPPAWFATGAVRVNNKGVIEFYYDAKYVIEEAKVPGKLAYFVAHEVSHILRFHEDRTNAAKHEHELANISQDMIINHDIDNTSQIGGWKPVPDEGDMKIPEKFHTDYKKDKKAYYYENMYAWLQANEKEKKKATAVAPQELDYFKEGQIVKVNEGSNKDEYRKITSVNKDGTVETELCDINAEIEKAKNG